MNLIVGCGYLGGRVAEAWLAKGEWVGALTRSFDRARRMAQSGIRPFVGDAMLPDTLDLPAAETLLVALGHDRAAPQSLRETYIDGLRNVLAAVPSVSRVIYISSTGVYGQADGEWVDEDSDCQPRTEGGQACLEAERILGGSPWRDRTIVLRLAGIYGPDRIPALSVAQSRLDLNPTGYLNLIHVEDAVASVLAAERYQRLPAMFLVADGHPVPRKVYYREVVRQGSASSVATSDRLEAGLPAATRSAGDVARRSTNKRVTNARMIEQLGVVLRFPSYRGGLAASVAG